MKLGSGLVVTGCFYVGLMIAGSNWACSRWSSPEGSADSRRGAVRVLTYSSLGGKQGFLTKSKSLFTQSSGCELFVETTLGATQVLTYLEEPRQREVIDVVMGLDTVLFERARNFLYPASPKKYRFLPLVEGAARAGFYPTDYAAMSLIYSKAAMASKKISPPKKLGDLTQAPYRGTFLVQDPRNSSPGLWFFLFADQIVKTEQLAKQWLALAPSWDSSYKMFLAGEAPMVWSYLTSLAYHASQGDLEKFGYVDFEEGLPVQVEGLAVVQKESNPYDRNTCIGKWIDFVMRPESQRILAETQFMLPAMADAPIPPFLKMVPVPKKVASISMSLDGVDRLITEFGKRIRK